MYPYRESPQDRDLQRRAGGVGGAAGEQRQQSGPRHPAHDGRAAARRAPVPVGVSPQWWGHPVPQRDI